MMLSLNDLVNQGLIPPEAAEELKKMAEDAEKAGENSFVRAERLSEIEEQITGLQLALCEIFEA